MLSRGTVLSGFLLIAAVLLPAPAGAAFVNSWHYWIDGLVASRYSDYDQGKAVLYDSASGTLLAWGRLDDTTQYGGTKHWLGVLNQNTGSFALPLWSQSGAAKLGHWDSGGIFPRGGLALAPGFLYAGAEASAHGGDIQLFRVDLVAKSTKTITLSGPGTCADSVQEMVYDAATATLFAAGFVGDCSGEAFTARSWVAAVPGAIANPLFTAIKTSTASAATTGWPNRIKLDKNGKLYANLYTGQSAGTVKLFELNKSSLTVSTTYTFNLGSEAMLYDFGFNPKNGDLYMTGFLDGSPAAGFQERPFLARYALPSAAPVWITTFSWSTALTCFPARLRDLAFAADGTVYAAGSSEGGSALVSFTEAGAVKDGTYPFWTQFSLSDITLDNLGGVYLAGVHDLNLSFSKFTSSGKASLAACTAAVLKETLCADGLDNDGDEFADCDDSDCAASPACLPPAPLPLNAFSYPNPFDSRYQSANLHWEIPQDAPVKLTLYDTLGGTVRRWEFPAGSIGGRQGANELSWDGTNDAGEKVRQGVYIMLLNVPGLGKKTARVGVKR